MPKSHTNTSSVQIGGGGKHWVYSLKVNIEYDNRWINEIFLGWSEGFKLIRISGMAQSSPALHSNGCLSFRPRMMDYMSGDIANQEVFHTDEELNEPNLSSH